jgi:hypothetical protein
MVIFEQSYDSENVQRYHSVLSCAQNEEKRISNNVCKFTKKQTHNVFSVHFLTG